MNESPKLPVMSEDIKPGTKQEPPEGAIFINPYPGKERLNRKEALDAISRLSSMVWIDECNR